MPQVNGDLVQVDDLQHSLDKRLDSADVDVVLSGAR